MTLIKQNLSLNFSQGLDTKTDDKQLDPGKFLELENSIFQKGGLLQKRNGFGNLTAITNNGEAVTDSIYTTTFNTDLVAVGSSLYSFSNASDLWFNKGMFQPLSLSTISLIKTSNNEKMADFATSSNGLTCVVWQVNNGTTPAGSTYFYSIVDSITGQTIVAPTLIPLADAFVGMPKVVYLGTNFLIFYTAVISANNNLRYFTVNSYDVTQVSPHVVITTAYGADFDVVVENNLVYIAYANPTNGSGLTMRTLNITLTLSAPVTFRVGDTPDIIRLTAAKDVSSPVIWVAYRSNLNNTTYAFSVNSSLTLIAGNTVKTGNTVDNLAIAAQGALATIFLQILNQYPNGAGPTDYIERVTIDQSGVVVPAVIISRALNIVSRAFIVNEVVYVLAAYVSPVNADFQSTYFLINSIGKIVAKLASGSAQGNVTSFKLPSPSVIVNGNTATMPYIVRQSIQAEAITSPTTSTPGVYSQYGINQVTFTFNPDNMTSGEIGKNLHLSGGFVWAYDGRKPVEQGFFVYPENITNNVPVAGGTPGLAAGDYWYQVTYEWTDNQGNIHRSAPSLPIKVTIPTNGFQVGLVIPTLRLTYKIESPVRISVYRYSVAQPTYYLITPASSPVLNNILVDTITVNDQASNAQILGNEILYTTGGVIENISPPATDNIALFDNRLWLIDAEDRNLLWFSKPVIEETPVEMSDLLTTYVSPTTSAQGSTGPSTAISSMDDKLIIFKQNAIYYINGTGPDITGSNNQYSQPTFITSTVGCTNQNSIVFMPQGLMFQSDKGIWLLGRDLSTNYIGAAVEAFNSDIVKSAVNIPGTNQVRFTLDSGVALMYDYYYGQWGTFTNVPAVSSTLFEDLHTYIDSGGKVFQETPGLYLDGSTAVTMAFKTSWMNLAGLQGYQRAYSFYLIGTYISPHTLTVDIAYDYEKGASQGFRISPDNFTGTYGSDPFYGDSLYYGGLSTLEQWRIFFERQKCQAFQISVQEAYDASLGVPAGAGLTLSGINLVVGKKLGYTKLAAARQTG